MPQRISDEFNSSSKFSSCNEAMSSRRMKTDVEVGGKNVNPIYREPKGSRHMKGDIVKGFVEFLFGRFLNGSSVGSQGSICAASRPLEKRTWLFIGCQCDRLKSVNTGVFMAVTSSEGTMIIIETGKSDRWFRSKIFL